MIAVCLEFERAQYFYFQPKTKIDINRGFNKQHNAGTAFAVVECYSCKVKLILNIYNDFPQLILSCLKVV